MKTQFPRQLVSLLSTLSEEQLESISEDNPLDISSEDTCKSRWLLYFCSPRFVIEIIILHSFVCEIASIIQYLLK